MGSTGYHAAFPARMSDGGSGGTPLEKNGPPLLKPGVLATGLPDPSHGTPGTAIRADIHHPGAAPSRLRGRGGGMAFFGELEQAQSLLYRKYLALPLLVMACALTLRYLRLVMLVTVIARRTLFLAPAIPYGVFHRVVRDRKEALFRRRAVPDSYESELANPSNFRGMIRR